jgi:HEAT repeat protein
MLLANAAPNAPTTDELLQQLKDPDTRTRRLAAEALGKQKVEAAVPALVDLLKDKNVGVRDAAIKALAAIGPKSVSALAGVLEGEDAARDAALAALERLGVGAKGAVDALTRTLKGKKTDIRIRAAVILGKIGADAKSALPTLFETAKETANVGPIIRRNLPSGVAAAAIEAALKIDPNCGEALAKAVLPDLTAALKSKDTATLQAVGSALAKLGKHAKSVLPELEEAQKRADGFAEYAIRDAIVAAGGDATKLIAAVVRDTKAPLDARLRAISSLRYSSSPSVAAITTLTDALKDSEPGIRAAAADAIGSLSADVSSAIPTLLALLEDEEVEKAAAQNAPGAILPLIPYVLGKIGKDAAPGLAEVLKDQKQKPLTRYYAAVALGNMGAKAKVARPVLEGCLNDKYLVVAIESAGAYAQVGGDTAKALPIVRQGLRHDSSFVIGVATSAAERMSVRGKDAVPDLLPLLEHKDREVRIGAAHALSNMGPSAKTAVPAMAKLLKSSSRERFQIATALARFGPDAKEAVPALIECLNDEEIGKVFPDPVLGALAKIGPDAKDAVPALLGLLKKPMASFQRDDMLVLAAIGPDAKDAIPQLIRYLQDDSPYNRAGAARALGGIGAAAKDAAPHLTKLLGDENRRVRVWATFALARITDESKNRVTDLIDLWNDDQDESPFDSVRFDVADALALLGKHAGPARDILLEAITDERHPSGTRHHAARALGSLGDDAAVIVPKLIELIGRPTKGLDRVDNCTCAAEALGLLGTKAKVAVPHLRKLLDDDESQVVEAALRALAKIADK